MQSQFKMCWKRKAWARLHLFTLHFKIILCFCSPRCCHSLGFFVCICRCEQIELKDNLGKLSSNQDLHENFPMLPFTPIHSRDHYSIRIMYKRKTSYACVSVYICFVHWYESINRNSLHWTSLNRFDDVIKLNWSNHFSVQLQVLHSKAGKHAHTLPLLSLGPGFGRSEEMTE